MTRTLTIPIRPYSAGITIEIPESTISEADWAVLMAVLTAMKPVLVEPDVVDAQIASPLELTPDEAIEVSLVIRDHYLRRGEQTVRRGTDMAQLADRLIAHERDDPDALDAEEVALQHAREIAWVYRYGITPPGWWHGDADEWLQHVRQLAHRYTEEDRA